MKLNDKSSTTFPIEPDGTLRTAERRLWADVPGTAPDGCTLDAEGANRGRQSASDQLASGQL